MIAPPDKVLPEEQQFTVEVNGAFIFRMEVQEDGTLIAMAAVEEQESVSLFRFSPPKHARSVREWFRSAGIRDIPRGPWSATVEQGFFYLDIEGVCIGTDDIPEDRENRPDNLYVLANVKLKELAFDG